MPFYYTHPEALFFMQINSDNFNNFLQDLSMMLNYVIVSEPGHVYVSSTKRSGYISAMLAFLCKNLSLPFYAVEVLGNSNSGPLQCFNAKKLSQTQNLDLSGESAQREQLSAYKDILTKIVENF